jgi:cytochrome d ubiquinol oxidase subunit II
VPASPATGEPFGSWLNPTSALVGALAVATGAYLAAVFLAADARRGGLADLERAFRRRALGAAAAAGALAVAGLVVAHEDARPLYDGLTSGGGLALVICSAVAGLVTLGLILRGAFAVARYTSAAAVGAMVVAWGVAQRPDFLPGALSFEEAAAGNDTLVPLLICVVVAMVILAPSLALLYRLTLQGRLDTEFRPLTAGDAADGPEGRS